MSEVPVSPINYPISEAFETRADIIKCVRGEGCVVRWVLVFQLHAQLLTSVYVWRAAMVGDTANVVAVHLPVLGY